MRNVICVTLALMMSGSLMAQAQDASTAEQAGPGAMNSATSYVVAAGQSDQFEIQEGKLAQSMGQSRKVRAFGKQMIEAHTRSTQQVMAAPHPTRAGPPPPRAPCPRCRPRRCVPTSSRWSPSCRPRPALLSISCTCSSSCSRTAKL